MDQYPESQENDVEVDFTGQRLTRAMPHGSQCDTHEAEEDSIQERRAQPRGVEMTRKALHQSEVRCNNVMYVLLSFDECISAGRSKLLFDVKWVKVAV